MKMHLTISIVRSCGVVLSMLISACSSHIPPEIRQHPNGAPSVVQVQQNADNFISKKIRWGGIILNTENKHNTSRLTILAHPLSSRGEPRVNDQSPGRFIAIIDKFIEPLVYSQNRKITITGKLLRTETLKVGEFPYEYPVIQTEQHYLWPNEPEPSDLNRHPYWWSDPWYDPWYHPYYPWHSPYYPYR